MSTLSDDELQKLYAWVDEIPLSRPKRNIARDFSDGVLVAEVISHYFPKLVELHNYAAANGVSQKMYNWNTLNKKVFGPLSYQMSSADIEAVVLGKSGAIERVLYDIQNRMAQYKARQKGGGSREPDSNTNTPDHRSRVKDSNNNEYQSTNNANSRRQLVPPGGQKRAGENDPNGAYSGGPEDDDDRTVEDLKEIVNLLQEKVARLELLVQLKDGKIAKLQSALAGAAKKTGGTQLNRGGVSNVR